MKIIVLSAIVLAGALAACVQETAEPAAPAKETVVAKEAVVEEEVKRVNTADERWDGPLVTEITTVEEFDALLEKSAEKPVFLYKHSTQCPVNARSAARLQKYLDEKGDSVPEMFMVKVIESKPTSTAIAEKIGVKHESPQLLLLKDGKSVWDSDHEEIVAENIDKALAANAETPSASDDDAS